MGFTIGTLWQTQAPTLADRLIEHLTSGEWTEALFAVAFASAGGVQALTPSIEKFRANGSAVRVWVGIDSKGTSKEALEELLGLVDETVIVHNLTPGVMFHPKVFLFRNADGGAYIVGSGNLTRGGLWRNIEAHVEGRDDAVRDLWASVENTPAGLRRPLDADLIAELDAGGHLGSEAETERRSDEGTGSKESQHGPQGFEYAAPPSPPPGTQRRVREQPSMFEDAPAAPTTVTTFVMVLGHRDVAQGTGYSRDVYVTLEARDEHPEFWKWPGAYSLVVREGHYDERYPVVNLQASGSTEPHRLYYYQERHEFRFNLGLLEGAVEGDILVIQLSEQTGVEYDVRLVRQGDSDYATWDARASRQPKRSPKRHGYL